jgi:alpha-tubulin suppressor-like RCC1 family protein
MENDVPQVYLLGKAYITNNEKFYIRNDPIIYMAAGDRHTIIVTESGRAFAFGDNNSGRKNKINNLFFFVFIGEYLQVN